MAWICKCGNRSDPEPPGIIGLAVVESCWKCGGSVMKEREFQEMLKSIRQARKINKGQKIPVFKEKKCTSQKRSVKSKSPKNPK